MRRFPSSAVLGVAALAFAAQPAAAQPYRGPQPAGYPQASNYANNNYSQQQLTEIRGAAERMNAHIEQMLEDLAYNNSANRDITRQADNLLGELYHFRVSVMQGASREHVYEDFRSLDGKIHTLLNNVGQINDAGVRRTASKVSTADQQLHYMIYNGDINPANQGDAIARQAHALSNEAREFVQMARVRLDNTAQDRQLKASIEKFAQSTDHFHEVAEGGADPQHIIQDFAEVDRDWTSVVQQINQTQGHYYLRQRALQVNTVRHRIRELVGANENKYRSQGRGPVPAGGPGYHANPVYQGSNGNSQYNGQYNGYNPNAGNGEGPFRIQFRFGGR